MNDQPNPYESPRTDGHLAQPPQRPYGKRRDVWLMVLLGLAIFCGVASLVPWLGIIFAVASSPIFIRYYILSKRCSKGMSPDLESKLAGVIGGGGLVVGTLAAAAGTCLGTCS